MEKETYRGFTINIEADDHCENPREWCNLGTLALKNNSWADEQIDDQGAFFSLLLEEEEFRLYSREDQDYSYDIDQDKAQRILEERYIVMPVYKFEHGGVCYNTSGFSCPWDSGQNGFIYISKDDVRKEYKIKRITKKVLAQVEARLTREVETFSQAASGEVYGYMIDDHDGNHLDSCFGYYGYDHDKSGLMEAAKSSIDYHIKEQRRLYFGGLKDLIKDRVPLCLRPDLIDGSILCH